MQTPHVILHFVNINIVRFRTMSHEGSCLCGALQFRSSADPVEAGYCHCKMCQNLSGSAVLPWASFRVEHFSYVKGEPTIYRSSPHGQREFCDNCGSQIAFRTVNSPETVEINIGTLNDPEKVSPQYHIYNDGQISWFKIDDHLPRYPGSGPVTNGT